MDAFVQDLRTALRGLRATPWFTVAVVATLTLAIGANTLIFSVVNGVLLNPLAFRSPGRLVAVTALASPSRFPPTGSRSLASRSRAGGRSRPTTVESLR